jgi:hypothetical protein
MNEQQACQSEKNPANEEKITSGVRPGGEDKTGEAYSEAKSSTIGEVRIKKKAKDAGTAARSGSGGGRCPSAVRHFVAQLRQR